MFYFLEKSFLSVVAAKFLSHIFVHFLAHSTKFHGQFVLYFTSFVVMTCFSINVLCQCCPLTSASIALDTNLRNLTPVVFPPSLGAYSYHTPTPPKANTYIHTRILVWCVWPPRQLGNLDLACSNSCPACDSKAFPPVCGKPML